ncbi:hypothetical protein ACM7HV_22210 [Pseudomonas paraeruginosa]|uniref:Uncharacterized protein n=1 Tax=Pseudomonas aeruginosa TaxID=287 RepID=A0ABD7K041_PSEAI|nr:MULTISPECIES: hypothetical protein [Pseudomonas aeruginosa group]KFF32153.1 hypothetical protein G039_0331360 [Pseudomonas aeruginosa VRFPA01]KFF32998.1 hypothetical protein G039_0326900 [Pseudomonas aeruginosa VRFPA01]MBG7302628.1 hypothetical protein [Pseudomonas aeruginosa]RTR95929.1 hypothetical protein DY932_17850 [Pseudomonas paraeruginosa]RTS44232.1 hypothetical protein DY940_18905 [Pseudomonas aeruginosa]
MKLFCELFNLFSIFQRARPDYTTIIYPSQGKPIVVHDGLSLRHERRWQMADSLLEEEVPSSSFSSLHNDPTSQAEPIELFQAESFSSDLLASSFEPIETMVNPANGMPMMDGCFDVTGNAYGTDMMSDSMSFDHAIDLGSSFSAFGFD